MYLIGRLDPGPDSPDEVSLLGLRPMPPVTPGARCNLRILVDRALAAHGVVPVNVGGVESLGAICVAESGEACAVLPCSVVAVHGDPRRLGVRRIVGPVLRRCVVLRTATDRCEPRDAAVVVRRGIVEVAWEPAAAGRLPGMELTWRAVAPPGVLLAAGG